MTFKVYEAVNSNLLGLNKDERKSGDYQLHPLIRDTWRSVDKYRDLQGNVPALTTNSDGDLEVDERVARAGTSFSRPFLGPDSAYVQIPGDGDKDTITINLRAENYVSDWNEGNINNIPSMDSLLQQNDPTGVFAGIPYFELFFHLNNPPSNSEPYGLLTTDPRMAGATRNTKPIMQQDWSAGFSSEEPILNHKFNYRYYDRTMEDSTYNIEIESVYNHFLDTSPDYESAIADIPESSIPNFYHIEISIALAAAGETIPYNYNLFADSIPEQEYLDLLLGNLSSSNIVENQTNSQGYLQFYSNNLDNIPTTYRASAGNIAVLSYDVADGILNDINGTIRDDRGTDVEEDDFYAIQSYPFYNKITIPYTNQWAGNNIIEALIEELGSPWVQNFITLVEVLIIKEYNLTEQGSNVPSATLPFTIYDATNGSKGTNKVVSQSENIDLAVRIEDVLNSLIAISNNETGVLVSDIEDIISIGDPGASFVGFSNPTGASFIKNYDDPFAADSFFGSLDDWYNGLTSTDLEDALNIIGSFRNGVTGEFQKIYQSGADSNHKDTPIMYMVEKRAIPVGQLSVDPGEPSTVVQRLFFGRDITEGQKGITYYDTQIKYGVRYQYDIKQIRLVVGERYYYQNVTSITNSGSLHQGRAIGNALGFYAEENVGITTTQAFQIANDLQDANGFTYLPEDEETPFVSSDSTQVGYYVYKIPSIALNNSVVNINDIFGPWNQPSSSPLGPWDPDRSNDNNINLDLLLLKIKGGDGFDGNLDGGAIGVADVGVIVTAPSYEGPYNPNDSGPPPTPEYEVSELQEIIEEGIQNNVNQVQGTQAQIAKSLATSAFEADIAAEIASGQMSTGGVVLSTTGAPPAFSGLPGVGGVPSGLPSPGPIGGVPPNAPDPFDINITDNSSNYESSQGAPSNIGQADNFSTGQSYDNQSNDYELDIMSDLFQLGYLGQ